jgi:hypothetical protein
MSPSAAVTSAVLMTALLLTGCAGRDVEPRMIGCRFPPPPTTLPADGEPDRALAAEYSCGDGLGYNLVLTLLDDGTFTCKWTGCLGDYGAAKGLWSRSADRVTFVSREATGMLQNYLRGALVVEGFESPALVLDQHQAFYLKYGLSRHAALQRTSLLAE